MPAIPSPLDPVTDPAESGDTVTTTVRSSWYDPDASSWEPEPALFEAFRASPPRTPIAVGPGVPTNRRRAAPGRPPVGSRRR